MPHPLVLITGANQGVGRATAQILAAKHNYHVIISSRNPEAGEAVAADIRNGGHRATSLQLDLTSEDSIKAAVSTIERDFGYLDVLINNAGILIDCEKSLTPWEIYHRTFTTNVIGTGVLTEYLVPLLQRAKAGPPRIVFVTSTMGSLDKATDTSLPWYPIDYKVYDASKAALNMLMLNYARVLDPVGGKVNAVCPGYVKTNMTRWNEYGVTPEEGAKRVVEMATLGEDGETRTFSSSNGAIPCFQAHCRCSTASSSLAASPIARRQQESSVSQRRAIFLTTQLRAESYERLPASKPLPLRITMQQTPGAQPKPKSARPKRVITEARKLQNRKAQRAYRQRQKERLQSNRARTGEKGGASRYQKLRPYPTPKNVEGEASSGPAHEGFGKSYILPDAPETPFYSISGTDLSVSTPSSEPLPATQSISGSTVGPYGGVGLLELLLSNSTPNWSLNVDYLLAETLRHKHLKPDLGLHTPVPPAGTQSPL
ncbi:hypothetical protein CNMCM8060_002936 [Aspergillus lentulus]|nr:hypothetical protein CNMCM8060_002936 [Aspergillus lentulus]